MDLPDVEDGHTEFSRACHPAGTTLWKMAKSESESESERRQAVNKVANPSRSTPHPTRPSVAWPRSGAMLARRAHLGRHFFPRYLTHVR